MPKNEFQIIKELKNSFPNHSKAIKIGIGDDCAVLDTSYLSPELVVTTDTIVENIHFDLKLCNGENIANKLFNINISDIVSMGAYPKYALINASFNKQFLNNHLEPFINTIKNICLKYNISLIGGDTTSSPINTFTMTLLGESHNSSKFTRHSSNIGDLICLTGYTGLSSFGFNLLKNNSSTINIATELFKNSQHRLDLLETLLKINPTSITDISDGLIFSINLLLKEGFGAKLYSIPKHEIFNNISEEEFLNYALYGGEDFELVFTISPENKNKIPKNIFIIGEIIDKKGIYLNNKKLDIKGYEHSFNN